MARKKSTTIVTTPSSDDDEARKTWLSTGRGSPGHRPKTTKESNDLASERLKNIARKEQRVEPLTFGTATFPLTGATPLVINRFSEKAQAGLEATMEAGSKAKAKKDRQPRDFEADYQAAFHRDAKDGWYGFPASGFRAAAISACRVASVVMTRAKLAIFVSANGISDEGIPLVRIYGTPERSQMPVRNANGVVDIRARPMFKEWTCKVTFQWDTKQFDIGDITNLLIRVGLQVGIGEGRPDSRDSTGMDWGRFLVDAVPERVDYFDYAKLIAQSKKTAGGKG